MKIQTAFNGPGKYLLLMMWWIFVFFGFCLVSYPIHRYLASYIPFFIAFTVTLVFGLLLNLADSAFTFWKRMGYWGKFATLIGSYAVTIISVLINTVILSSHRMIDYFDGDPDGSFGMP